MIPTDYDPADPMNSASFLGLMAATLAAAPPAADPAPHTAEVRTAADADDVPERFRMPEAAFPVTVRPRFRLDESGVEVLAVSFPSAVASPHAENNTVHAELFRPLAPGPRPIAIVLDIMDGRGVVSRGEALWLAQHGISALAVTMPYYGPRRPPGGSVRMMSTDVNQSVENTRQAVLDCRRAAAWLLTLPETDPARLGVVGTSLGSFVGGVAAAAEPRITTACLILGGGGLVDAFYDHPKATTVVQMLRLFGVTKETLRPILAPADPLTYAPQLKTKRLLLIAASRDEVVPPAAMRALWEATGKPKLVWYDSTHVGAAAFAFPVMRDVIEFLKQ